MQQMNKNVSKPETSASDDVFASFHRSSLQNIPDELHVYSTFHTIPRYSQQLQMFAEFLVSPRAMAAEPLQLQRSCGRCSAKKRAAWFKFLLLLSLFVF